MNYYPCNSGRSSSQFTGTLEEWNALTDQQKALYDGGDWTNDFNGSPVDSAMSASSERPLQNKVITQEFNKVYKSTDSADTTIDSADYIPFYDVSTSTMKKITVSDADFGQYTIDSVPTQGSTNLVYSGGVYTGLSAKANSADLGTAAYKNSTNAITQGSTDLAESGAVYTAIQNKVLYFTGIACAATTGNFATYSNAAITANHVVCECVFANQRAIDTDVTWTTAAGSVTLNGTCSVATTVSLVLVKKDN